MSKHKSEQVALNIDWDLYGLINKINKIFHRKLWVVDVAVHILGKYRENVQSEFIQNNTEHSIASLSL